MFHSIHVSIHTLQIVYLPRKYQTLLRQPNQLPVLFVQPFIRLLLTKLLLISCLYLGRDVGRQKKYFNFVTSYESIHCFLCTTVVNKQCNFPTIFLTYASNFGSYEYASTCVIYAFFFAQLLSLFLAILFYKRLRHPKTPNDCKHKFF